MASQTESENSASPLAFWDKQQVAHTLGISIRTVGNLVKEGDFPPGVRVGRFLWWSSAAVTSWQQRLFATQEQWRPTGPVARSGRY